MLAQVLAPQTARTRGLLGVAALVALGLYLLAIDQGLALPLLQEKLALSQSLVHEFLHDGRHVLGVPCH
jgi:hypothetical protein